MGRVLFRIFLLLWVAAHLSQWRRSKLDADGVCRRAPHAARPTTGPSAPVLRCRFPARNPGVVEDGRLAFRPIAVSAPSSGTRRARAREAAAALLTGKLKPWPGLQSLSLAVWLGKTESLPAGLAALYRQGGLLHLLALSGQHVASLWLVMALALACLAPWANRRAFARRVFYWTARSGPLAAAGVLVFLNPGNEPMARAAAMLAAWWLVRARGLETSGLRTACSTVALLLILSPERAASDSFLLSAVATVFLCAWVIDANPTAPLWRRSLSLSIAMPWLLLPISAFFFARVALMATLNGVAVGWLWTLVWVPAGFLSVAVAFLPAPLAAVLLSPLEQAWVFFAGAQLDWGAVMSAGYWWVPRPTWAETLAWEVLAVGAIGAARRAGRGRA